MKKLLIVAYGGGHLNIQLEIAEYYKRKEWEVTFLSTPNTTQKLMSLNRYKVITFKELETNESAVYGEKLVNKIHNNTSIDVNESRAYTGVNYLDLIINYGEDRAETLFRHFGRRIFFPVFSLKNLMKKIKPDLVSVTYSAARAERAAIHAAKEIGVKVMAIEDLFGTAGAFSVADDIEVAKETTKQELITKGVPSNLVSIVDPSIVHSFKIPSFHTGMNEYIGLKYKIFPDYLFCINNFSREELIKRDVPREIIQVVGQPSLDKIVKQSKFKKEKHGEKTLLITTQPLDSRVEFLNVIYPSLLKLKDDYKIIIRPHPSSDGNLEKNFFEEIKDEVSVEKHTDFYSALNKATALITQTSTTAIESALYGVKTLSLSLGDDDFIDFEKAGIAPTLKKPSAKEFAKVLEEILRDDYYYNPYGLEFCDGKATERIFNITN